LCCCAIVARQHDNPDALLAKRRDSLSRRFFDCIGNGKDAGGLSVDPDEDGGRAVWRSSSACGSRARTSIPFSDRSRHCPA
jgi:hypothetical protein